MSRHLRMVAKGAAPTQKNPAEPSLNVNSENSVRSVAAAQSPGRHDGTTLLRPIPSQQSQGEILACALAGGLRISDAHPAVRGPRSRSLVLVPKSEFSHEPVLLDATIALLADVPAGIYIDATLGGGGHASAVLGAHARLKLLGIDQDADAIAAATENLAAHAVRVKLVRARFDRLAELASDLDDPVTAVLFDLGVSSPQLDQPERGFAYRLDGPLDMRLDRSAAVTAADLVNERSADELARILRQYGDERFAGRIANRIVRLRPLHTTVELADVVRDAIPAPARRKGGHPARRTFQALRIAVNDELDVLGAGLEQAIDALAPGGRLVVISYHSGEDRIVKDVLRTAERGGTRPPRGLPQPHGQVPRVRALGRAVVRPDDAEIANNPRSKSARLRAVEKLGAPS